MKTCAECGGAIVVEGTAVCPRCAFVMDGTIQDPGNKDCQDCTPVTLCDRHAEEMGRL